MEVKIIKHNIIKKIQKCFGRYNVNVKLIPFKATKNGIICYVHLAKGTREKAVSEHVDDVRTVLHIPVLNLYKENTYIFLIVGFNSIEDGDNVKYNALIPMLKYIDTEIPPKHLTIVLGRNDSNNLVFDDLDEMPHLMCTGATMSGKSVFLACLILSLAYKMSAQYVNFVIFDVGGKSLSKFEGLPHLSYPIVRNIDECIYVINALKFEMDRRLSFDECDIDTLPYIVCVMDEFVSVAEKCCNEFSAAITDILRRGRKAKIHIVLATQTSTKNDLKIDNNNITAKIAFKCANYHESVAAINVAGAEKLTKRGAMLFKPHDSDETIHLQGAYISDDDCRNLVNEIKSDKNFYENKFVIPKENPLTLSVINETPKLVSGTNNDPDQELIQIIMFILSRDDISVNKLKTQFSIGNRCNGIMDRLVELGIVSELSSKKPRTVLPRRANDLSAEVIRLLKDNGITDKEIHKAFDNRISPA